MASARNSTRAKPSMFARERASAFSRVILRSASAISAADKHFKRKAGPIVCRGDMLESGRRVHEIADEAPDI